MTDLTYRPFQPQDAPEVKAIINEAFMVDRYVPDPRLIGSVLELYLRAWLLTSTFTRVAVLDGRVVGVLMCRVAGEPRLPGAVRHRLVSWAHALRIGVLGLREHRSLRQYRTIDREYRALRKQTDAPLTDELTLFAVAGDARGLGAGRTLYDTYLAHLRAHGRTTFYLYTDSSCSVGFYEKRGVTRAAARNMTVYLDPD